MKYAALLFLFGCGDLHISSDPVIVKHQLDLSSILPYCEKKCEYQFDQVTCINDCIYNLMETLGGITGN